MSQPEHDLSRALLAAFRPDFGERDASAPTSTVSSPLRSHGRPVISVFKAPATKRAMSVHTTDKVNAVCTSTGSAYGITGNAAPSAYASATTIPDRSGATLGTAERPSSSVIIVSTQKEGSAVTCSTIASSAVPR